MDMSVFDLFKIGIGPSSSHTVGPMVAARRFLLESGMLEQTVGVEAHLYGSLALTGVGHATDKAVILGLMGETPQGVDPTAVVLCHMDPSGSDPDYQRSLAERGVWLEFDMIGMPYRFSLPGEGQSPSPADTAFAICGLVGGGYRSQLLLSHDLFLKSMLRKFGGNGLAYVPVSFAARLVRSGMDAHHVSSLMQDNPRSLFESAGKG